MTDFPFATLLILVPFLGAIICSGLQSGGWARRWAVLFSGANTAIVVWLWAHFPGSAGDLAWTERAEWIPSLHVEWLVGFDALSMTFLLLAPLVITISLGASAGIRERAPLFCTLMLLMESGLMGTFLLMNFVPWFLFWELSIVPAYFLIKLWGGPDRRRASFHFLLVTMAGSLALLLSFQALYASAATFDFQRLAEMGKTGELASALSAKLGWYRLSTSALHMIVFLGAFAAFAVKLPMVPFHSWLPGAYAEAPTPVTMALTGIVSKMGVYGMLRIVLPIFPEPTRQALPILIVLALVTIVYPAWVAWRQPDLKRMLAYSSINHLGYCALGVFLLAAAGESASREKLQLANGVLLQVFNHGIVAAALFCCAGMIEAQTGTRLLESLGGLRRRAPVLCGWMGIFLFASLGLPGLNGFVGEYLLLQGAFGVARWTAVVALLGLLGTAVFLIYLLTGVFWGPSKALPAGVEMTRTDRLILLPALLLCFILGVYPRLLLDLWTPENLSGILGG